MRTFDPCAQTQTLKAPRNGSVKTITDIIHHLNEAKLDPKVGQYILKSPQSILDLPCKGQLRPGLTHCHQQQKSSSPPRTSTSC